MLKKGNLYFFELQYGDNYVRHQHQQKNYDDCASFGKIRNTQWWKNLDVWCHAQHL